MNNTDQKKLVVFVGSTSRSGSTMLDMMLGSGPSAFSLGEVNAHFRPYRKHHINSPCACGNEDCEIRKTLNKASEENLYTWGFDQLGVDVIVDSSKELTWVLDQYKRIAATPGLEARIVMIYKDPVSLAHSYFKRGESIDKYKHQYKYYSEFLDLNLPFVSVEFNNLVQDPAGTLKRLCEVLGIEYFDGKEVYWNQEMHHYFGSGSVLQTYNSKEPKIRSTETFREDFYPLIPKIEMDMKNDSDIARSTKRLKEHNIEINPTWQSGPVEFNRKPWWYYKRKAKAIYSRMFLSEYKGKTFKAE